MFGGLHWRPLRSHGWQSPSRPADLGPDFRQRQTTALERLAGPSRSAGQPVTAARPIRRVARQSGADEASVTTGLLALTPPAHLLFCSVMSLLVVQA
jgi:hypothetical protein